MATRLKQIAADYAEAWSSKSPEAVASFYAEFPDLLVHCDEVRTAGDHAIFVWTLEGHHSKTRNYVKVGGWEEWELDKNFKVKSSLGWFDAAEYERQIAGNAR